MDPTEVTKESDQPKFSGRFKMIALAIIVLLGAFLFWQFGSHLSLENLAKHETALRDYQVQHPILVFVIAFAIYVAVTGMSLPGATGLSLMYVVLWVHQSVGAREFCIDARSNDRVSALSFSFSRRSYETIRRSFGQV